MLNLNFLVMLAIFFPLFIPNVNSFIHVRNRNPHCSRCDDCYEQMAFTLASKQTKKQRNKQNKMKNIFVKRKSLDLFYHRRSHGRGIKKSDNPKKVPYGWSSSNSSRQVNTCLIITVQP